MHFVDLRQNRDVENTFFVIFFDKIPGFDKTTRLCLFRDVLSSADDFYTEISI